MLEGHDRMTYARVLRCGWMAPDRIRTLSGALGFGGHTINQDDHVLDLRFGGFRQLDYITGVRGMFNMALAMNDIYDRDGGYMVVSALLPAPLGRKIVSRSLIPKVM